MEAWEPRRDFLIGVCGKTEREAETTSWVELRALEKGHRDAEYSAWARARFIGHTTYLFAPVFGKGVRKERDPRKFFPLPGDDEMQKDKPLVVYKVSAEEEAKLNKLFATIRK